MAAYQSFSSARASEPDPSSLLAQLKALDPSAGVQHPVGSSTFVVKKETPWTAPQIAAAQNVIDTAPAATPELAAQAWVDQMPLHEKAILLTLLDQINVLRARAGLAAITPAQAIQAVRDKAGTL